MPFWENETYNEVFEVGHLGFIERMFEISQSDQDAGKLLSMGFWLRAATMIN